MKPFAVFRRARRALTSDPGHEQASLRPGDQARSTFGIGPRSARAASAALSRSRAEATCFEHRKVAKN